MKMSFYDWCKQNNKQHVLDEWDTTMNSVGFNDISAFTHKKS